MWDRLYYYRHEQERIEIVRFLMKYFAAIRKKRQQDWENPRTSIICNTLGVGAFIRVLHFLFVKMFLEEFDRDPSAIQKVSVDNLVAKLDGIEHVDFSKEGEFGQSASAGALNKLKVALVQNMSYFGAPRYQDFERLYRNDYLARYRKWLDTLK